MNLENEFIPYEQAIKKWDGHLPSTYSGGSLPFVKTVK